MLTLNIKITGQITLNTKPHPDPHYYFPQFCICSPVMEAIFVNDPFRLDWQKEKLRKPKLHPVAILFVN